MITKTVDGVNKLDTNHNTLSALLESALTDLENTMRGGVAVNMSTWLYFENEPGGAGPAAPCSACLAGAVILSGLGGSLEMNGSDSADPDHLVEIGLCTEAAAAQLYALNEVRQGFITDAYKRMFKRNSIVDDPNYAALRKVEDLFEDASWPQRTEWATPRVGAEGPGPDRPGPAFRYFKERMLPALKAAGL